MLIVILVDPLYRKPSGFGVGISNVGFSFVRISVLIVILVDPPFIANLRVSVLGSAMLDSFLPKGALLHNVHAP